MNKQRVIYLHLVSMNLLVHDSTEHIEKISAAEWFSLKAEARYKLKKYYLKNNIKLPT